MTSHTGKEFLRRNGALVLIYVILVALVAGGSYGSEIFRSPDNIIDVLRQATTLGLVAMGQFLVMLVGGADMSGGMVARAAGLGAAVIMTIFGVPPILAIALAIGFGAFCGLLNGLFVARLNGQPFIVTLGSMGILYGVSLAISSGPTKMVPFEVMDIYELTWGPIPVCIIAMAVLWAGCWYMLDYTRFGRSLYAIGGSRQVARLAGLKVERTIIIAYILSGILSAAAGIFLLARSGVGNPNMASGLEFQSIVAAAIGGVSLYGGRGRALGVVGAVLLVTVISNLFDLYQVSAYYQDLLLGLIVVVAVASRKPEAGK